MISFTSARGAAVIAASAMPEASNRPILRIWQSSPLALLVVSVHRPARAVNLGACRSAHRSNRFCAGPMSLLLDANRVSSLWYYAAGSMMLLSVPDGLPASFAPLMLTRQSTIPPTFFGCRLETARQARPRPRGAAIARRDDEPGCVKPTRALGRQLLGQSGKPALA